MPDFMIRVHVTDADLMRGWNGNRSEYLRSVDAALFEVQGDDGGAYRALVTWPDQKLLSDTLAEYRQRSAALRPERDAYNEQAAREAFEFGAWAEEALGVLLDALSRDGKTAGTCEFCGQAATPDNPLIEGPSGGPMCWDSDQCMTRIEG